MTSGILLGLGAALAWTFANASIQPSAHRFGALGALVWAQLTGGLLAVAGAWVVEGALPAASGEAWAWVGGAGVAACLAYGGLFEALRRGRLSVVTPINASWVVVSAALGVGVLGEELSATRLSGVALVVAGNVLIARTAPDEPVDGGGAPPGASLAETARDPRGALMWALVSAVGFGVMVPAVDQAGQALGRLWAVPLVWGAELVVLATALALAGRRVERPRTAGDWAVAARVGAFEVLGFVLLSLALGLAPVGVVSPTASLATALSVLWGLVVLRERLRLPAIVGAASASVGVVLVGA